MISKGEKSGGCGTCVVLISKYDPLLNRVEDFTASSCLTLLCSINGCSITTSDGIGNSKQGFHPSHERFSGFHASQCGFCTPGMCGFPSLVLLSMPKRTILQSHQLVADACKSFAEDVDMEDLGLNSFWRKGRKQGPNNCATHASLWRQRLPLLVLFAEFS
ncbi:putative aldehyde oxidase [Medicago truncatula]|uniref:Putative aldehyde oxidase n=1 Tax=Medicago truncatula TaxID=3880 RepID=A0A396IYF3_MEDTR|nr:putative aldehyde oxidase [Medicago truncatula]